MDGIRVSNRQEQGLRPVNLQTDLSQLADLIESAFSSSMDSSGRAAVREMRYLGRVGVGLGLLSGLNELVQGMNLGYVWQENGRIVGNVSVYPADVPKDLGRHWIIANVAVYPEYRGRGIAKRLMQASLDMIRQRAGGVAILQVDHDNTTALNLYRQLGFTQERAWSQWRRNGFQPSVPTQPPPVSPHRVVQRKLGDSAAELRLAQRVRPSILGGVDWLRPTHLNTFRLDFFTRFNNWLNLREVQRLVIRDDARRDLLAWLQIETAFGVAQNQFTFMALPQHTLTAAHDLIGLGVRRFSRETINLHHPHDDELVAEVLRAYHFSCYRTVIHMKHEHP